MIAASACFAKSASISPDEYEIQIHVVDRDSGNTLSDIRVILEVFYPGMPMGRYIAESETKTDSNGFAILKTYNLGPLEINAEPCDNFFAKGSASIQELKGGPDEPFVIEIKVSPKYCGEQSLRPGPE